MYPKNSQNVKEECKMSLKSHKFIILVEKNIIQQIIVSVLFLRALITTHKS